MHPSASPDWLVQCAQAPTTTKIIRRMVPRALDTYLFPCDIHPPTSIGAMRHRILPCRNDSKRWNESTLGRTRAVPEWGEADLEQNSSWWRYSFGRRKTDFSRIRRGNLRHSEVRELYQLRHSRLGERFKLLGDFADI